jgi:hypothetical protein
MKNLRNYIFISVLLATNTAVAERTFKWVDTDGQVHYGNRVPPEYAKAERKVINEQGRVVMVYEAAKTPEEKAAAEKAAAAAAREKALAEKQAIRDHSLLATYASKQDIELARNGKVASIEGLLQLTSSRIESMKLRLLELTEEAATYERSGKQLPHTLESQIKKLRAQVAKNEVFVREKEQELDRLNKQFDADISRYIELTANREINGTSKQRPANLEAANSNPDIELNRHDRALLTTYTGEEDLLLARDQKLAAIDELIRLTNQRLESMQIQLSELSDSADVYESRGQKLPEVLLGEMKNIMSNIAQGEELLALKQQEKTTIEKQYSKDIARYRQLTASN